MPFLISASRRTDIPAFYGQWFRTRLDAGWCETRNPFSKQIYRVSLRRKDVLGWIFWSRNYAPFVETLFDLHADGQRFICHFTVNNFPPLFEPRVPPLELALETAHTLAETFGPDAVLWRYDPILLTSCTPPAWHRENFGELAKRLKGATRRCTFSFPTMYKKTVRNLEKAARQVPEKHMNSALAGFPPFELWSKEKGDFSEEDQRALLVDLALIAYRNGMEMRSCCGEQWTDPERGIQKASCADWTLLKKLGAGAHLSKDGVSLESEEGADFDVPLHPTRQQCNCYKSIDIGAYQTCGHGCAYCYAVDDPFHARSNVLAHRPDAAILG